MYGYDKLQNLLKQLDPEALGQLLDSPAFYYADKNISSLVEIGGGLGENAIVFLHVLRRPFIYTYIEMNKAKCDKFTQIVKPYLESYGVMVRVLCEDVKKVELPYADLITLDVEGYEDEELVKKVRNTSRYSFICIHGYKKVNLYNCKPLFINVPEVCYACENE